MALALAGLLIAFASAAIFAVGVALQALAAGRQASNTRPTVLLVRLSRQPTWITGSALTLVAWLLQACALRLAPLTLVQPALATQVVWLAAISGRVFGRRPHKTELHATCAIAVGLAGTAWAAPKHSTHDLGGARSVVALAVLGGVALLPQLRPRIASALPFATAACSGLAYAWIGIATKLGVDDLAHGATSQAVAWAAGIVALALVGTGNEMTALRSRRAGQVVPIVLALEVAVPVALAPLLTSEVWRSTPGGGAALVPALALVVAGAVVVARAPDRRPDLATASRSSAKPG